MLYTKSALADFATLDLRSKQWKIKAIATKLSENYPFYVEVLALIDQFGDKVSENILNYVYEVTMKLVDINQNHDILADEMKNIQDLKKTIK
jgi:hypothetical protein